MNNVKRPTREESVFHYYKNVLKNELSIKFKNMATSIFKWEGFASDFIGDEIERQLYELGSVVFFKDSSDDVQKVLRWAIQGKLNIYGNPISWRVIGVNGFNKELTEDNSVLIWNNKLRTRTRTYVDLMILKLVNVEVTTDTQINALKIPFVFSGDEKQLLTFKNIYKKISDGEPVLYTDKMSTLDTKFDVHNTNVDFKGKDLVEMYDYYEGRILKHLGLKYIHSDKKERLVVAEANANNEYSDTNFASQYDMRLQACKLINKMYGLNVSVSINPAMINNDEDNESEGDEDDSFERE